jgi:hypothetical protein
MHAIGLPSFAAQLGAVFHLFAAASAKPAPGHPRSVRLDAGEMWIRRGLQGATIVCRSGCLWLTHEPDKRGVVLQPGDVHRVERPERLIAQALLPVELEVVQDR